MSKILLVLLATMCLVTYAADLQIFVGTWNDGAKMEWACPKGTNGITHFRFTQVDGTQYTGSLDCGVGI